MGTRVTTTEVLERLRARSLDLAGAADRRLEPSGRLLSAEDVHEVRKTTKRLRSAWQLLRPALGRPLARPPDRSIREVAKVLEAHREVEAMVETIDDLIDDWAREKAKGRRLSERQSLEALRSLVHDQAPEAEPASTEQMIRIVEGQLVAIQDWPASLQPESLAAGIRRAHRKARKAGRRARKADSHGKAAEHWHKARRHAKYERYQIELLGRPAGSKKRYRRVKKFGKKAGDHHDLQDLRAVIALHEPELKARGALPGLASVIRRAEKPLLKKMNRLYGSLYDMKPKQRAKQVSRGLKPGVPAVSEPA